MRISIALQKKMLIQIKISFYLYVIIFFFFTVAAAATLPRLEQVIGLEGAFFYSFLGLIAPSILDVIFNWERGLGKYNWILVKDIILIVFGTFVLVAGVTQSLREIIGSK